MKNLLLLYVLVFNSLMSLSQDTLVNDQGVISVVKIISEDSIFITNSFNDTYNSVIVLTPISSLIFIKYSDGKTKQFFLPDTIINNEGKYIIGKIIEIDTSSLTYFSYDRKINNHVILPLSNVLLIKFHDGTTKINSSAKEQVIDYYTLGTQDAKLFYKIDPGVIIGEVIFGVTSIFILPAIPAIAIMLSPPKMMHTLNNPNDKLLTTNPTYRHGYEIGMKNKKRKVAKITFFSSIIPGFIVFANIGLKGLHD